MKKLIIASIAVLALAGLGYYYLSNESPGGETGPRETVKVKRGELVLSVLATGTVTPETEVEVKSKAGGEITSFPYNEGDVLEKGAVAVTLDPETELARVRQAEANTLVAEARLEKARITVKDTLQRLQRQKKLYADGIISAQELDDAEVAHLKSKADVRLYEAELVQAREALTEARERLADTEIRAPITGTILVKYVETGQVIASTLSSASEGTPLFTMANLETLYVEASVDEIDISRVSPGQRAEISVDSLPGKIFEGRVTRIAPKGRVERTVTVFDVVVEVVEDGKTLLKPGMTADVRVITEVVTDATLVPNETLVTKDGTTGVYLNSTPPEFREVRVGKTDGILTVVLEGLKAGDVILKSGFPENTREDRRRRLFF